MRFIGIRHRIKMTAEGEAKPTQVVVVENGKAQGLVLPDEQAELDFLLGVYPVVYRKVLPEDNLALVRPHHIKWKDKSRNFADAKVPEQFEGLRDGDIVAMALGGSGDYLAYALARRADSLKGAHVVRIPPFILLREREAAGRDPEQKDDDATLLASLAEHKPDLFYETDARDRDLIWLRECFRVRQDAMKARIACEQRLRQRIVGAVFCSPEGHFPEGGIEKFFDEKKANDIILTALAKEEAAANKALLAALAKLPVYTGLLERVEGCGPAIGSRIIASVIDIRRFARDAKLKAFMGVHVLPDGRFPRKRTGSVANWHNDARQALYLLGDQFNRRPDSRWGRYLRTMKARLRAKHPEVVMEKGKKRYTDAHIHKMALWRTLTRFVEALYADWSDLDRNAKAFSEVPPRLVEARTPQVEVQKAA